MRRIITAALIYVGIVSALTTPPAELWTDGYGEPIMFVDDVHDALAVLTIWREARNQGPDGMRAVAWAIRNRMADPRWANTPGEVALQNKQFSCWDGRDPNRVKFPDPGDQTWDEAEDAWLASAYGNDPTHGANHYHAVNVQPYWAKEDLLTANIGGHNFYKL